MYNLYQEAGFPQKRMSQFYNVIKPCLINPSDLSTPISTVIPPPELHLHIGLANWVWNIVKSYLGEQRYPDLLLWCRARSITIRGYHGTGLDGGNSKNFFKASKDLGLLFEEDKSAPFTDLLQKFDLVTKACFSRELLPGWKKTFDDFIFSTWALISHCKFQLKIKITIPWKIHILVSHVKPFLEMTGRGLSDYSEQTGESGHHKVEIEMGRFRRDLGNPLHGEKMLAMCSRFNSKRI